MILTLLLLLHQFLLPQEVMPSVNPGLPATSGQLPMPGMSVTSGAAQEPVYRHHGPALLPDTLLTPGAVSTRDTAVVCHRLTTTVRHTTEATKRHVYASYGIPRHAPGQYEIDHLIPLELGGKDTVTNLWPQPAKPLPGFHQKDIAENVLHRLACTGRIPLDSAQRGIARDWYAMYRRYVPGVP